MAQKFLVKKDIVDIISPSTSCTKEEFKKIKTFLEKIDLKPRIFFEKELSLKKAAIYGFPSFEPKLRFEQFKSAVNSDSKIIWCARGGYGSAEILSFLEEMPKPKIQKIFIGFSDISSLNNFLIEKWNWQVVSAPMLLQMSSDKVCQKSILAVCNLVFGKKKLLKYSLKPISNQTKNQSQAKIQAKITGGCLSVLVAQFGTKNQINWHDKILFLEDIGESGERLDRYFNHLTEIFSEKKLLPKAIVLGNFLEANSHGTPQAKNIKTAIKKFVEKLEQKKIQIPFFIEKTKYLGHSKNMLPLILGAKAEISSNGILTQKF